MNAQSDYAAGQLLGQGYYVIDKACEPDIIAALDADLTPLLDAAPFCRGDFYGARTKRLGALLRRTDHIPQLIQHPVILDLVDRMLSPFCDRVALNLTQAVELHPGALAQIPHCDQDLWGGAPATIEYQVNVMWPLSSFTAENGATLLWPGTNRTATMRAGTDPVAAVMEPGSALLWLGSTLHGGGANVSSEVRRGVIVSYCLGWLKPFENQWLVYPPNIARHFSPELAALVGYAQHRPNLGNVEGQCPSILLQRDRIDGLAATDALLPEQADALAEFVAGQRRAAASQAAG